MLHGSPLTLLGGAFFLSGACALVYQVAWQRILALHTGVGSLSIAVIVGAFMVGLGMGSHLGGTLSTHLPAGKALRGFALIELGIGAFGAVSAWLYHDVLYVRFLHLYRDPLAGAALHVCALLLPTVLMGMSLPLLVKGSVQGTGTAPRTIGLLYGLNVLGASVGALVTPWVLVRHAGVRGALAAAALGNALAGVGALLVAARPAREDRGEHPPEDLEDPREAKPTAGAVEEPLSLWTALYAASGFCALALELVWFRLLDVAVKSTAFTFGTVLSLYLLGVGMGTVLAAGRARRIARPLTAFLACQCVLLLYAGTAVLLLVALPEETYGLRTLVAFWRRPSSGFVLFEPGKFQFLVTLYGVLPLLLFGPPTLLMGASFPILHRAVQDDPRTSGRKAGLLQAANIAGCTLASLGLGLVGFSLMGTSGTLRMLLVIGLGFALLGMKNGRPRVFAGLAAGLVVLLAALPGGEALWRRLHGASGPSSLVDEDATGVAALVAQRPGRWNVVFGGKSHSWVPFGGIHSYLGAIPAVMHEAPLDVAIIGLGSGDSAWAAGCREETRSVTVFELSAIQPRLLRRLALEADPPQLRRFLDDPRLSIRVGDGRNALATGETRYDVIEADALWPSAAYSGNLYSEEFFRVCLRKLKRGGLMCTWAPTSRVTAGFTKVFPHVASFENGAVLVGSHQRIPFARASWKRLLGDGHVAEYLGQDLALGVLKRLRLAYRVQPPGPRRRQVNEDLFPRDEFATPGRP